MSGHHSSFLLYVFSFGAVQALCFLQHSVGGFLHFGFLVYFHGYEIFLVRVSVSYLTEVCLFVSRALDRPDLCISMCVALVSTFLWVYGNLYSESRSFPLCPSY